MHAPGVFPVSVKYTLAKGDLCNGIMHYRLDKHDKETFTTYFHIFSKSIISFDDGREKLVFKYINVLHVPTVTKIHLLAPCPYYGHMVELSILPEIIDVKTIKDYTTLILKHSLNLPIKSMGLQEIQGR